MQDDPKIIRFASSGELISTDSAQLQVKDSLHVVFLHVTDLQQDRGER
jgi:hypothetical protein